MHSSCPCLASFVYRTRTHSSWGMHGSSPCQPLLSHCFSFQDGHESFLTLEKLCFFNCRIRKFVKTYKLNTDGKIISQAALSVIKFGLLPWYVPFSAQSLLPVSDWLVTNSLEKKFKILDTIRKIFISLCYCFLQFCDVLLNANCSSLH